MTDTIEATEISEAGSALTATPARIEARVITPGWGSSGYYAAEMLRRDGPVAFPAGTHVHIDHPDRVEEQTRPERSVRTLAGQLTTPAEWRDAPEPGLYASIEIRSEWADTVRELADIAGLSIRAAAEAEPGEIEGRAGDVITRLLPNPHNSVDVVTVPGRGGRIVEVLESAPADLAEARRMVDEAASVGTVIEARVWAAVMELLGAMTEDDRILAEERVQIVGVVSEALALFRRRLRKTELYTRRPWDAPGASTIGTETTDREGLPVDDVTETDSDTSGVDLNAPGDGDALDAMRERLAAAEARSWAAETSDLPKAMTARVIGALIAEGAHTADDGMFDPARCAERFAVLAEAERAYLVEVGVASPATIDMGATPDVEPDVEQIFERHLSRVGLRGA